MVGVIDLDFEMILGEEIGDRFAPFDNDDVLGVAKVFLEVVSHKAGVGEAIKVVMDKVAALGEGVGFGNGETGASDRGFDAKAKAKAASKSSFASADITDELNDGSSFRCGRILGRF